MLFYKRELGNRGEKEAVTYLKKTKHLKIVKTNYSNFFGEIDIIAKDKDCMVFVEVKTRTSIDFGFASQAVDYKKQQKIIKIAQMYTKNAYNVPVRFDIVEVYIDKASNSVKNINHIENAFGV